MQLFKRLAEFQSSFRYRLFSVFTLLTALLSIILGTLYITSEISQKREHAASQLHLLAVQLGLNVRLPLYAENREALLLLAQQAAAAPNIHAVVVTSNKGEVLADVRNPATSFPTKTLSETVEVSSNPQSISVESALTGASPPTPIRIGFVKIERNTADLSRDISRLIICSLCIALIVWLTISCICYLVLRRVTQSFNALMKGIESMYEGNYSARIDITSDDEPAKAAHAVNQLAASLLQRDEENAQLTRNLLDSNHTLGTEINERIQAENTLRESEHNLKVLFDILPVGVAWTDHDGNVEYLNNFFSDRFGYDRQQIKTAAEWYSLAFPDPVYRDQILELRRAAFEEFRKDNNYTPMYESRITCSDGKIRQVLTKFAISSKRIVIILIDITEREILQEQIIKAQKLESIGILAGGVAHNFNNALTGVLGFISLASSQLDESHKSRQLLQHAERATKRAASMTKELLTFAKGGTPFKKPVSVRKLIEESTVETMSGTTVLSLLHIPDSIQAILGDEDQLKHAFKNVILNALQAMPKGGTLSICAENTQLTGNAALSNQQTMYVRLTFTDEGSGISTKELNNIFDPYYTSNPSNTGLGLSTVHSIVTKHGGQVLVDSTIGKGTTFTILLPATGDVSTSYQATGEIITLAGQSQHSSKTIPD